MALDTDDSPGTKSPSESAKLSRATVRLAMAALQQRYALDQSVAFEVLRDASQRHNVKLRLVAAKMISSPANKQPPHSPPAPALPFTAGDAEVLTELMRVTVSRAGADRGSVQLRDPVHGGLHIEGIRGFGQGFVDAFSYVSGHDTSCGHAFDEGSQTVVADVESSRLFSESARATLLAHEVCSCVSTPILDSDGMVRGIVSSHQRRPDAIPTEAELRQLRGLSDPGRRLARVVRPDRAAHSGGRGIRCCRSRGASLRITAPADTATIAAASRLLTDR